MSINRLHYFAFRRIPGLPIIPLVGGGVGELRDPPQLLLVPQTHRSLLEGTPLLNRVVDVPDDSDVMRRLRKLGGTCPLSAAVLAQHVLPRVVGDHGRHDPCHCVVYRIPVAEHVLH